MKLHTFFEFSIKKAPNVYVFIKTNKAGIDSKLYHPYRKNIIIE